MKPAPFVHHAPRSVDEAVAVLAQVGHDGKVLAGGQSLIPILNMRLASPAHLVDINRVAGLADVAVTDTEVRVGALVRHAQLEHHDEAYAALPLLRQALVNVAHPVIRNRGTTVGSIAHADAAGEMPAMLALTDGVVEAVSAAGAREIAVADFFQGALGDVPRRGRAGGRRAVPPVRRGHRHGLHGAGPPARRLRHGRRRRGSAGRGRARGRGPAVVRVRHRRAPDRRRHRRLRRSGARLGRLVRGGRAGPRRHRARRRHPRHGRLPRHARRRAVAAHPRPRRRVHRVRCPAAAFRPASEGPAA